MAAELVHYAVSEAIAQITLDRAPVNALSMPLIDALLAALQKAKDDPAVSAVIVGSLHKVFCAGLDMARQSVSKHLAVALDAFLILQSYSRLVIDATAGGGGHDPHVRLAAPPGTG